MHNHAHEHDNGVSLANAAMDHFKCEFAWMWDTAQTIFDALANERTGAHYAQG